MANDPVTQMVQDPDFPKLPLSEQKKALVAHDAAFGGLDDDGITKFVQTHQAPSLIPNATVQAHETLQKGMNVAPDQMLGGAVRAATPWGPASPQSMFTAQGQREAAAGERYNNYEKDSGRMAGQLAGTMATGGILPAVKGTGMLPNFLRFLGRAGASGAGMGAGDLATGATPQEAKSTAESGAVAQPIGEGMNFLFRKAAPAAMESALNVTDRMRGRGRTIGQSVLDETSGVRPGTIAAQSTDRLGELTGQMENAVHQATASGATGSTQPAHDVLNQAIANTPRNAKSLLEKMNGLRDMMDLQQVPAGQARRMIHTPDELLEIKRGIGKEIESWPPEWQKMKDIQRVKQGLYGALDGELDRLVPGNAEANQTISSLIPASRQASRLSDSASLGQKLAHRAAAHTGALAGSGMGAFLGSQEGTTPQERRQNALLGSAAGFVLPEILTSPTAQATAARLLHDAPTAIKYLLPFLRPQVSNEPARTQE